MKEIWKPVRNYEGLYEGLYEVSNTGKVKSLNYRKTGKERILKTYDNGHGYLFVVLSKDGNREQPLVHVLVATAFIENPDNLPEVNHKDENKYNNCMDNLEWCSHSYNNTYNDKAKKVGKKLSKSVIGINKISGLILEFPSTCEASRQTGIDQGNITKCCKGKRYKSAGGYYWHYASESEEVANEQE